MKTEGKAGYGRSVPDPDEKICYKYKVTKGNPSDCVL